MQEVSEQWQTEYENTPADPLDAGTQKCHFVIKAGHPQHEAETCMCLVLSQWGIIHSIVNVLGVFIILFKVNTEVGRGLV